MDNLVFGQYNFQNFSIICNNPGKVLFFSGRTGQYLYTKFLMIVLLSASLMKLCEDELEVEK